MSKGSRRNLFAQHFDRTVILKLLVLSDLDAEFEGQASVLDVDFVKINLQEIISKIRILADNGRYSETARRRAVVLSILCVEIDCELNRSK